MSAYVTVKVKATGNVEMVRKEYYDKYSAHLELIEEENEEVSLGTDEEENEEVSLGTDKELSEMTHKELKEEATRRNLEFKGNASKETLIALLEE